MKPGVVVPVRVPSMNHIEQFNIFKGSLLLSLLLLSNRIIRVKEQYLKLFNSVQTINSNIWNYLTVCKQ